MGLAGGGVGGGGGSYLHTIEVYIMGIAAARIVQCLL